MEIEEGKFYRDAYGNKIGPMVSSLALGPWKQKGGKFMRWDNRGVSLSGAYDLVEEWVDPPSVDLTKLEKPLGLLDEATLKALKEHGGPYEKYTHEWGWVARDYNEIWWKTDICRVKPAPQKPREWWMVLAQDQTAVWRYDTLKEAQNRAWPSDKIVHVREVL